MDVSEMKVGDFLKLAEMFGNKPAQDRDLGLQIVVLDRGFVYVGKVTLSGGECVIREAKNIRRWGTTNGLGQLVGGPTPNTELDVVGTVRCAGKAVMHFIACEDNGWKKEF